MRLNSGFKPPISFLSVVTIAVTTILFTTMVIVHEHAKLGTEALLIFVFVLFGPVTLLYLLSDSGGPIGIGILLLPISSLTALLAASLPRPTYSVFLKRLGWFLWVLCQLMVTGWFI